jgi:hypothetical protein
MKRVVSMADMNRRLTGVWGGFSVIKEQTNIYFMNNFDELVRSLHSDGFVKSPRSRLANPEE